MGNPLESYSTSGARFRVAAFLAASEGEAIALLAADGEHDGAGDFDGEATVGSGRVSGPGGTMLANSGLTTAQSEDVILRRKDEDFGNLLCLPVCSSSRLIVRNIQEVTTRCWVIIAASAAGED
jgi:hypothetical protein